MLSQYTLQSINHINHQSYFISISQIDAKHKSLTQPTIVRLTVATFTEKASRPRDVKIHTN